ncbi:hypothetical protein M6D81_26570 [Paenibacillus sp. J5C_2022]|uniref:hypothetical protein n=1 Tax=Paenibacillus sp. J5C2022 TaxID=2977129 RepID=UPI0021D14CAB|nr:hypothetical protein [Paenibacillus sp. J5C2022]MCU6712271.1 hypothetical protein [Paenibacillus sp. J5C2022]
MIRKKHCLFCNELVPMEKEADYVRFVGCFCSPGGSYHLHSNSYLTIQSFSYERKRGLFPIVSAYIREKTDVGNQVFLTLDDMNAIPNDSGIPASVEEKEARLLQFLYRNSEIPGEAVALHPLQQHYNLTYSLNLQEFVYIIERLRDQHRIVREGGTLRLTEQGWEEAALQFGGQKQRRCLILIPSDEEYGQEWLEVVMSTAEHFGYTPCLMNQQGDQQGHSDLVKLMKESKLIVSDITLTHRPLHECFAAGYAVASNIPVVWTMKGNRGENHISAPLPIRPVQWESTEELSSALAQALSVV